MSAPYPRLLSLSNFGYVYPSCQHVLTNHVDKYKLGVIKCQEFRYGG